MALQENNRYKGGLFSDDTGFGLINIIKFLALQTNPKNTILMPQSISMWVDLKDICKTLFCFSNYFLCQHAASVHSQILKYFILILNTVEFLREGQPNLWNIGPIYEISW